jgi:BirA family biotin operon repressor/biotin-[acetyl-CoA-carboxylase] ligase
MLVAVACWEALAKHLSPTLLTIKWPNDIYYGDKKLVGILIENSLSGSWVDHTIAGIGVNVNQTEWLSNAPNPISMKQITGQDYPVEQLLCDWISAMQSWEKRTTEEIKEAYMQHLYRRQGWHLYVEREVSIAPTAIATDTPEGAFMAELIGITPQGELQLRTENKEEKTYHFKQIRFVVKS